jgi:multidrug efflux pump subunit AcrB
VRTLLVTLLFTAGCKRAPVDIEVALTWPHANPSDVERHLVVPVERALTNVPQLRHTQSVSRLGGARLIASFPAGTDTLQAKAGVDGAITLATLPPEASAESRLPAARQLHFQMIGDLRESEMRELADWVVSRRLRQVAGVIDVEICGGSERRIEIHVDAMRVQSFGVSMPEIAHALSAVTLNQPKGNLDGPRRDFTLRVAGFQYADGFGDAVIAMRNGTSVRLKDIATVMDTAARAACQSSVNGQRRVVGTVLLRESYTNGDVEKMLQQLRAELPQAVRVELLGAGPMVRLRVPAGTSAAAAEIVAARVVRYAQAVSHGDIWVEILDHELRLHGVDAQAMSRIDVPGVVLLDRPDQHTLVLTGGDLSTLRQIASTFSNAVVEGAEEVPTVEIEAYRVGAARLGVNFGDLAETIAYTGEGREVSTLWTQNRRLPVILRTDDAILSPSLFTRRVTNAPSEIFHRNSWNAVLVHFSGKTPDIGGLKLPVGCQVTTQTP